MRGIKIRSAVAPRCFNFSMTNEPRKPDPPVTITRLSCQNFSAMFAPVLLNDELGVPIFFIGGIPNDPCLQREQDLANAIIYIEGCVKAKHLLNLRERYRDITHIAAERQ